MKPIRPKPVTRIAQRPTMPTDYGVAKGKKGLLPWSHVNERMTKAMHYWICTVTPDCRPYAVPVDGLWIHGNLYFGGSPETRWQRNLAANTAVSVHLESATDVVILRGRVKPLSRPEHSLSATLSKASAAKYGYAPKPEDYGAGGVYVFQASLVVAWTNFPKDATRWKLRGGEDHDPQRHPKRARRS